MGYFEIYDERKHMQYSMRATDADAAKLYLIERCRMSEEEANTAVYWMQKAQRFEDFTVGHFIVSRV